MLNPSSTVRILCCLWAVVGVVGITPLLAQQSVGVLRTERTDRDLPRRVTETTFARESFVFDRNLIFFEAQVDGRTGHFILDTGAPTLVVNNRGIADKGSADYTGLGAGGTVSLTDRRIESFEMGGREIENCWAIGLDLRSLEARTQRRIDGLVGYELLNSGELRIDFANGAYQLLASRRRPAHGGRAPTHVIPFSFVDHLPVIRLRVGGQKLFFAIDTGAGSNLIDRKLAKAGLTERSGERINIQGLDGNAGDYHEVRLVEASGLPPTQAPIRFVSMDLGHLQTSGTVEIAGILGSEWLSQYTVGIDYRRRKLYLW